MRYAWSKEEAQIIKAAWADDAGRAALTLVVQKLAMLHGQSFADTAELTAFHEGRRFVGIALMTAVNTPLDKLVRTDDDPGRGTIPTATERAVTAGGKPISKR
jgi:hypothetical protein